MTNDYDCSILGQHLEFPPDKEEILVTGTGEGASGVGDGDGGEPLRPLECCLSLGDCRGTLQGDQ